MNNILKTIAVVSAVFGIVVVAPNAWAEYTDDCITFSSLASFTLKTDNAAKNWNGTLWTSTDKVNWTEWNGLEVGAAQASGLGLYYLYVRGDTSNTVITGSQDYPYNHKWVLSDGTDIACKGNIETLRGAVGDAPSPTKMGKSCYNHIFSHCTALSSAPTLTATTLADGCYECMFSGCTSLMSAPELPATTLTECCYYDMFNGCTSLMYAPSLPATTLTECCYAWMFEDCTSLICAPELPAISLANGCYEFMFSGCTSLTSVPALPATTLANACYYNMFEGCQALEVNVAAPGKEWKIPATKTVETAWGTDMFADTKGTLRGQPELNTMYYVASAILPDGGPYTEMVDGVKWTFMVNNNVATIRAGLDSAIPSETIGSITIPSILGERAVTGIGDWAFSGCSSLTSVTIPSGVTYIGFEAFKSCAGLSSMSIPSSVTLIAPSAFVGCSGLNSIEVDSANVNYTSQGGVLFNKNLNTIVRYPNAKWGEYTIPSSVTSIGEAAFWGCGGLTGLTIPSSVTSIGENAFCCCEGLAELTIPSSVTSIGDCAFYECLGLVRMTLPSSVTSIGRQMFRNCISLADISIPSSVTNIGECAFHSCSSLINLTIPSSVKSIDEGAFLYCDGLERVTIQLGVASIGGDAFYGCSKLTKLTIPSSVTSIGELAFYECDNLNAMDFEGAPPDGIGSAAVKTDATIRYNAEYEAEWLPVIEACGWTNAKPYYLSGAHISSVTAQQQNPGGGKFDISYTASGIDEECQSRGMAGSLRVYAVEQTTHVTNFAGGAYLSGDTAMSNGTHKLVWDMDAQGVFLGLVSTNFEIFVSAEASPNDGVQLWENGPYWAECNLGATKPEEYGYYFWWGDTTAYKRNANNDGWISVKDGLEFSFSWDNCPTCDKNNSQLQSSGYIDSTGNLVAAHDAATAHRGAPWRMPTDAEFSLLVSYCDTSWTQCNGVWGRLVKGLGAYASKSIFLPAAGYGYDSTLGIAGSYGCFWSSTPNSYNYAWFLEFDYSGNSHLSRYLRCLGKSIRPLIDVRTASLCVGGSGAIRIDTRKSPSITDVAAQQHPGNGRFDISYTASGIDEVCQSRGMIASLKVYAVEQTTHVTNIADGAYLSGDTTMTNGAHELVWDMDAQGVFQGLVSTNFEIFVSVEVSPIGGVQLWKDGPYWAECNVGATKPEEYGYYFWWGDTIGYKRNVNNDGWISVDDGTEFVFSADNCTTWRMSNSDLQSQGYIDSSNNLMAAHDAATKHCGAYWRMPTNEEINELKSNCTTTWITTNGISGRLITGQGDFVSRSIFLPCPGCGDGTGYSNMGSGGYYLSSTPCSDDCDFAKILYSGSGNFALSTISRYYGMSVRPLRESVTRAETLCASGSGGIRIDTQVTPAIVDVTARQRYPWNGKVDISYTVANAGMETLALSVLAIDKMTGITNVAEGVSGDTAYTNGQHHVVWDMAADGLAIVSTDVVFVVSYKTQEQLNGRYCVIDLSGGDSATSYPVSYLDDVPSGGWGDEYKTTKLVLRRIEPGTCVVTVDEPYYVGVFEVTQKQYELVTGETPSRFSENDKYPVEYVSYDMIRGSNKGAQYPSSTDVDADSFMGKLRSRTGLQVDLPTEAQWEYAGRAGAATSFFYGGNANGDYMWYSGNSGSHPHDVGTRKPNDWGLYDIHGNVFERCRDWYSTGARAIRGGGWYDGDGGCRFDYRVGLVSSDVNDNIGFRLVRELSESTTAEITVTSGSSDPVRIDLAEGTRTAATTEMITYSTAWADGASADAVAVVSVNGEVINEASGSGTVEWTPEHDGTYELTHQVMVGGSPFGAILTATFVVTVPVEPGGEIVVPEGKAEEKATEINSDPAVKAQYLKAPGGVETTSKYMSCFDAVATSGSSVGFILNEQGTNEVVNATTAVKTTTLDVVFSAGSTVTIDNPLVGFYYSLKQGGDISVGDQADLNKLGGRDSISFELTKGPLKYFYQTIVSPKPVPVE